MLSFLPGNIIDVFCRDGEFGSDTGCDSAAERIRVVSHTGGQFEAIHRVFPGGKRFSLLRIVGPRPLRL
jgi:hypothetical protein